jgi:hypothetical protein
MHVAVWPRLAPRVRRASREHEGIDVFAIVVEGPRDMWAWNGVSVTTYAAGAGKTHTEQLQGITIERRDGLAWIRFQMLFRHSRHGKDTVKLYDTLVACKVDAALACAAVTGNGWGATKISTAGTLVTVRNEKTDGTVESEQVKLEL